MNILTKEDIHAKGSAMPRILKRFEDAVLHKEINGIVVIAEDGEYPKTNGLKLADKKTKQEFILYPGYDDEGNPGDVGLYLKGESGKPFEAIHTGTINKVGYFERDGECFPYVQSDNGVYIYPVRSRDGSPGVLHIETDDEDYPFPMLCQVR